MNNKQAEIKDCANCLNRYNCDIQIQHVIKHGCRLLKMPDLGFAAWIERMEYHCAVCNGIILMANAGVSFREFAKAYADVYRMLNAEWSLQGKAITCKGAVLTIYPGFNVYSDLIIEKLRQKLIEDIKQIQKEAPQYFRLSTIWGELGTKINKRFGVTPRQKDSMNTME